MGAQCFKVLLYPIMHALNASLGCSRTGACTAPPNAQGNKQATTKPNTTNAEWL